MIPRIRLFLGDDRVHDFGRSSVISDFAGMRILDVEIAARDTALRIALDQVSGRDLPGALVFLAVVPPGKTACELLIGHWCRLRVFLAALRQRQLKVPDVLRRAAGIEEDQVRRNVGIGCEHPFA
jgi:hypothetical protein